MAKSLLMIRWLLVVWFSLHSLAVCQPQYEAIVAALKNGAERLGPRDLSALVAPARERIIYELRESAAKLLRPDLPSQRATLNLDAYSALALLLRLEEPDLWQIVSRRYFNYNEEPALFTTQTFVISGKNDVPEIDRLFWGAVFRARHPRLFSIMAEFLSTTEPSRKPVVDPWGGPSVPGLSSHEGTYVSAVYLLCEAYEIPDEVSVWAKKIKAAYNEPGDKAPALKILVAKAAAFFASNNAAIVAGKYGELRVDVNETRVEVIAPPGALQVPTKRLVTTGVVEPTRKSALQSSALVWLLLAFLVSIFAGLSIRVVRSK